MGGFFNDLYSQYVEPNLPAVSIPSWDDLTSGWQDFAYNTVQSSPHLQNAYREVQAITPESSLSDIGIGGFRAMQEAGRGMYEDVLGLPVQAIEDIVSTPYKQLGYLAEGLRTGQAPEMKPGASLFETITGTGLINSPTPADISTEGLKALGSFASNATLPEAAVIAQGQAERGDVDKGIEDALRANNEFAFGMEDYVDPSLRVLLQLGLDPAGPGMAIAGGSPLAAKILGGLNLPGDIVDTVETSGNYLDVGRAFGWESPEAARALSTALATGVLTGADVIPETLETGLNIGEPFPGESTLGSEAGVLDLPPWNPDDVPALPREPRIEPEAFIAEGPAEDFALTKENLGISPDYQSPFSAGYEPSLESKWEANPEAAIYELFAGKKAEVPSIEESIQDSTSHAIAAKVNALAELGFGEDTIGGLTPNEVNEILSGGMSREQFMNESYDDKVARIMRQHGVDQSFAEQILKQEGIEPVEGGNIVFHGTPYDFDQFDLSKIGTGEGAQAYGHGFYFAENPEVAGGYAKNLEQFSNDPMAASYAKDLVERTGSTEKAIEALDNLINNATREDLKQSQIDYYKEVQDYIKGGMKGSQVLASQIPHPDEFLDLDIPLGEQSEKVKQAIPEIYSGAERHGENFMKALHDIQAAIPALETGNKGMLNSMWVQELKNQVDNYVETGDPGNIYNRLDAVIDDLRHNKIAKMSDVPNQLEKLKNNLMSASHAAKLTDKPTWFYDRQEKGSKELREKGLKGVKYLDRQSRYSSYDITTPEGYVADYVSREGINETKAHLENALGDEKHNLEYEKMTDIQKKNTINNIKFLEDRIKSLESGSYKKAKKTNEKETRNYVVFDPKDIKILEKTKDISREKLASFVSSVKKKYGQKSWRRMMNPSETGQFKKLQGNVVKATERARTIPASWEKMSPAVKDAYLKGELPEHYSENLPKNEELEKERANVKAQIKAIGPAPSIPVQASTSAPVSLTPSGNVPPSSPPNKPPKTPKGRTPKSPRTPINLNPISALRSATRSTLENLKHMNPEIGRRVELYDETHAKNTSRDIYKVREATKDLPKKSEERVVNFLDGQKIVLNSQEAAVAKKLRTLLDDIANRADAEGVLIGYRQGYFPRKYADRWEWQVSPVAFKTKGFHGGHLQTARQGNKMNFRRDFKVLEEYANEAERRISEARFLGKNQQFVTGKRFAGDRATVKYLETAIRRITGQEGTTRVSKTGDVLRRIVALGDLTRAAIFQPAQITHTASQVGMRRSIRAIGSLLSNFNKEELNAIRSGAAWPNINHEVSKALGDKGYMHGIPTMDKIMRVHANIAGRMLYQDALGGNKFALNQLKELGLNTKSGADAVGKAISDKTQFRTGTMDMPLWSHSPMGKMVTQYSSFMYAHAKFMRDLFKNPVKNFGKIARFGGLGILAAGEGVGDLRAVLDALIPGDDEDDKLIKRALEAVHGDKSFDEKDWTEKLKFVMKNRRVPMSSPGWRALQNFSMIGGVGIFQSMFEKATSKEDFIKTAAGPAISQGFDLAESIRKDFNKGQFREIPKFVIQNLPTPLVSPYKLAKKVFPNKNSSNSFGTFETF